MFRSLLVLCIILLVGECAAANINQREINFGDTSECWIFIRGTIGEGDAIKFLGAMNGKQSPVTVWLESPGGSASEGLAIARVINTLKLNTYVHSNGRCDSICSIMLLSGKRKMAANDAHIGVHAAHDPKTKKLDYYINAMIAWYLGNMDYPEELVNLWLKTEPNRLINLNDRANVQLRLGIETVQPVQVPLFDSLLSD